MSRFILIQEDDYERQYRVSMDYLNNKYHNHPTRLKNIPASEAEAMALAMHGAFGRNSSTPHSQTPTGKLVI